MLALAAVSSVDFSYGMAREAGDPSTAMVVRAAGPAERSCATFDINRVVQLVREHEGDVKTASKDVIMFIGESQSGKSTLINGLLGVPLKKVRDKLKVRIEVDEEFLTPTDRFARIGDGRVSETEFPAAYSSHRDGPLSDFVFLDTKGFGDTKIKDEKVVDENGEIASYILMEMALKNARSVRIVCLNRLEFYDSLVHFQRTGNILSKIISDNTVPVFFLSNKYRGEPLGLSELTGAVGDSMQQTIEDRCRSTKSQAVALGKALIKRSAGTGEMMRDQDFIGFLGNSLEKKAYRYVDPLNRESMEDFLGALFDIQPVDKKYLKFSENSPESRAFFRGFLPRMVRMMPLLGKKAGLAGSSVKQLEDKRDRVVKKIEECDGYLSRVDQLSSEEVMKLEEEFRLGSTVRDAKNNVSAVKGKVEKLKAKRKELEEKSKTTERVSIEEWRQGPIWRGFPLFYRWRNVDYRGDPFETVEWAVTHLRFEAGEIHEGPTEKGSKEDRGACEFHKKMERGEGYEGGVWRLSLLKYNVHHQVEIETFKQDLADSEEKLKEAIRDEEEAAETLKFPGRSLRARLGSQIEILKRDCEAAVKDLGCLAEYARMEEEVAAYAGIAERLGMNEPGTVADRFVKGYKVVNSASADGKAPCREGEQVR